MGSDQAQFAVRRATLADLPRVLEIIDTVWPNPGDIAGTHPFLFHEARVPNHFVYESEGDLWGVIGAYPYDVRLGGVVFRMLGIGQVICDTRYRGRGVFTSIMREVIRSLYAEGFDAAWLSGDRKRYAHFGWEDGGRSLQFVTNARYLPDPAGAGTPRPMDLAHDLPRIREHIAALPGALLMPEMELRMLLEVRNVGGWFLNDSFIVLNRDRTGVLFADGDPDQIALLISHQQRINSETDENSREMVIETPDANTPLLRACAKIFARMSAKPACSFRVGCLIPFLRKAAKVVEGAVPDGTDRLALVNTDTDESAMISAAKGRIEITEGAGEGAVRLDTTAMGQALFSPTPPELVLPNLGRSSPLRALFPLNVHIPHFLMTVV
jgi:predicted N-acetyltransferase YhbS